MKSFLETALEAVSAASLPILEYYHGQFDIELKEDLTPVTVADREAEQAIRSVLRKAFPDHGIYGEEFGRSDRDSDYLWLIDPIDGTKSFVRGYGMFSTQLALMHHGEIIVGVSNAPVHNELAWAARGEGAWLNDRKISVSDVTDLKEATVSTGNLGSMAAGPQWLKLGNIMSAANRTRGYGDYYHYHRLAQGQVDAVIESDVNILDIAALVLIIREAGGVFTDLGGGEIDLNTRSVLAATPQLHAQLLQALA